MTRIGWEVFLFILAVALSMVAVFFNPGKKVVELRLESPRVFVVNPWWNTVKRVSEDFVRMRMIYELVKIGGYVSTEGVVVENSEDLEKVLTQIKKFGKKYEIIGKFIRIPRTGIVVMMK